MPHATSATDWLLGNGRYQVKRKLGEGGMAFALLAHDQTLGVDVVLKVPRPNMMADPEFAARFRREIRSMQALTHEHIVKIKDVGEHEGMPFYVMDLLAGGSLQDRFEAAGDNRTKPMPPDGLADWLEPVAAALDFIHQRFVHRDIKPANILFDADGNAFVSDFGIVKAITDGSKDTKQTVMTQAGMVIGTGPYMAPELSGGEKIDGRADQYALAVTVYQALSGRVPFEGTSIVEIVRQQILGKIPPLHGLVPTLPRSLMQVIEKGLSMEPKERYATCMAFAKAVLATVKAVHGKAARVRNAVCPACRKPFALPPDPAGKSVTCPACGAGFTVNKKQSEKPAAETRTQGKTPKDGMPPPTALAMALPVAVPPSAQPSDGAPRTTVSEDRSRNPFALPADTGAQDTTTKKASAKAQRRGKPLLLVVGVGGVLFLGLLAIAGSILLRAPSKDGLVKGASESGKSPLLKKATGNAPQNQLPKLAPENKADAEWLPLFNGKDLTGWIPDGSSQWRVNDGAIVSASNGNIHTARFDFKDFHLRAEVSLEAGALGSLQFRNTNGVWNTYWVQFGENPKLNVSSGGIIALGPRLLSASKGITLDPDRWYKVEVIVTGWRFVAKIDGRVIAEAEDNLKAYPIGCIALQRAFTTNQNIRFRRIEIKELPAKSAGRPALTNGLGMKLVYIPPGKFMMGSPPEELEREPFDKGNEFQHEVVITKGFYMGAYAVTQAEYETVTGKNPSYFSAQGGGKNSVPGLDTRRFPVEFVSWFQATDFCRILSQKEGKSYRLPSEAEWEYACRAGTKTPFHFGATISPDQANYNGHFVYANGVKGEFRQRPMPVGSFAPNKWGLYDMHGNVWQWCEDWYDAKYYNNSPKINPANEAKGQYRVLRGGSWLFDPGNCRSAHRRKFGTPEDRYYDVGFRVLLSSP